MRGRTKRRNDAISDLVDGPRGQMNATILDIPPHEVLRTAVAVWGACALLWSLSGFALDTIQTSALWLLGLLWLISEFLAVGE